MPVRIVSDGVLTRSRARHRRVLARGRAGLPRRCSCRRSATSPGPAASGCGSPCNTAGVGRRAVARGRRADPRDRAAARGARPPGRAGRAPPAPATVPDDFLLYWSMLAMVIVPHRAPTAGPSWDPRRLDNLTLGLARHARRNLHRLPGRDRAGCAGSRGVSADVPPDVRRRADAHAGAPRRRWSGTSTRPRTTTTIMERILDWVAFTPLQNATGDPAISLPLATTAAGLPQGMMFGGRRRAARRRCSSSPTSSRRPVRGPGSRADSRARSRPIS